MSSIDPNARTTHTAPVMPYKSPAFPEPPAVVSFDGSGEFKPGQDTSVMLRSENGGAGAVSYADLQEAVRQKGGTATGQEVARALSRKDGQDCWMTFGELPPGMTHPVVDYVFRLHGDQLQVSFQEVKTAAVIAPEDGNIATVDLFGTGQSSPETGSALMLHAHTSDGKNFQSMVSLKDLKSTVQRAGGEITPGKASDALKALAPPVENITFVEITESPQHISDYDGVQRTFRLDERGNLVIDYDQPR
ncbi:MAG: hypothetical protein AMXMBFR33_63290 [Candidatus Xenobia bacterium]